MHVLRDIAVTPINNRMPVSSMKAFHRFSSALHLGSWPCLLDLSNIRAHEGASESDRISSHLYQYVVRTYKTSYNTNRKTCVKFFRQRKTNFLVWWLHPTDMRVHRNIVVSAIFYFFKCFVSSSV